MGPGSQHNTLDEHFNDWNHKKVVTMGESAVPVVYISTNLC